MSSHKLILEAPSLVLRKRARDEFAILLKSSNAKEHDWQNLFDRYPFLLTETLPVRMDALYRQVPLLNGTPDYVFNRPSLTPGLGDYGVIELKRPHHAIIGSYSSKIVVPSKQVRAAQQQVTQYLDSIRRGQFLNSDEFFVAGNRRHAFIIIGSSSEITSKAKDELIRNQFADLLPSGIQLFTYDELFHQFTSTMPPCVQVVFCSPPPTLESVKQDSTRRRFRVAMTLGLHARPCSDITRALQRFKSCEVYFEANDETVSAREIFGLMMLTISEGEEFIVTASGVEAVPAIEALTDLLTSCDINRLPLRGGPGAFLID